MNKGVLVILFVFAIATQALNLKPIAIQMSEILITREYYKDDHKAVISFQGAGAVKADLVVYQLEKITSSSYSGGSGAQSSEMSRLEQKTAFQVRPNPTKTRATITLSLVHAEKIRLSVYDVTGKEVAAVVNSHMSAGQHNLAWDCRDKYGKKLPNGTYFIRLESTIGNKVQKVMILK